MDPVEIKDSIKDFIDTRLKNPYFASVIVVWLITNRVIVFALFNFDSSLSLQQRIAWVHEKLESFKFLRLHGFSATIISSLLIGYLVMVFYNYINLSGKLLYIWVNKSATNVLQKVEPNKWIERKEYKKLEEQLSDSQDELNKKREDVNKIQSEHEVLRKLFSDSENAKTEKDILVAKNAETLKLQEDQIRQFAEEKNKFKIIYARYGKYETFIEVTKIVFDLISTQALFNVENNTLGFDPYGYKVKELFIEYEYNSKIETLLANENEIVELKENKLFTTPTEESKEKQLWLQNQNELSNIFKEEWTLTYSKDKSSHSEKVRIDNRGNYFANGKHALNLIVTKLDSKQIVFNKHKLDGKLHATDTLERINDNLLKGTDSLGHVLEYKKN